MSYHASNERFPRFTCGFCVLTNGSRYSDDGRQCDRPGHERRQYSLRITTSKQICAPAVSHRNTGSNAPACTGSALQSPARRSLQKGCHRHTSTPPCSSVRTCKNSNITTKANRGKARQAIGQKLVWFCYRKTRNAQVFRYGWCDFFLPRTIARKRTGSWSLSCACMHM